ncbi:MAG: DUF4347 domain-containing protein [Rhodocyclales bacterium GT-UBC]|nr:MAG: DUF4347 domain-containing protein [Rhodocyclales bacterium GT-UBC]
MNQSNSIATTELEIRTGSNDKFVIMPTVAPELPPLIISGDPLLGNHSIYAADASTEPCEIVFIESDVGNIDQLRQGIGADKEVHILDANQNGLQQIAQILAGRTGIDALHLISHGSEGSVNLGALMLDQNTLATQQQVLHEIGLSLATDADILLYGCNIGSGSGKQLLEDLAVVTGADIAASSNLTGNTNQGGDWALEVVQGRIESNIVVDQSVASLYSDLLSIASVTVDFDTGSRFDNYGGMNASENVIYKVSGDANYKLVIDGESRGASGGGGPIYVAYSGGENKVTFSFQNAQTFTANSIYINNVFTSAQNIKFYAYDASNNLITSSSTNFGPGQTNTVNFSGMTSISKLVMKSGAGSIQKLILDNLSLSNIQGDSTPPTVNGVTSSTANGTYKVGDTISIQANFSETVTVTGTPQLTLETGTTDRVINYASGSGSSTLTFTYTVQAGDTTADLDYLSTGALALNGGTIKDAAGNDATLTLPSPGAANSLGANKAIVIDGVAPTVTSINSSTANGTYKVGDTISIQANFSETVTVTGTPQLTLETGTTDRVINYASGSGSSTLTFTYTVQAGDTTADLDYLSTSALALNGGTIKDSAGNDATLTLASPGAANSLGANKAIVIDTTPSITSATYDASTGVLNVTGQNLIALAGANNDIAVSKLSFLGEGGSTYTLTSGNVEITSATAFSVTLNATDRAAANLFFNKNGTSSTSGTTYNVAAAEDWAAGAAAGVTDVDLTGNGITVSNVAVPTITSATYDAATGALLVTGTGFLSKSGASNDIVANKFTFTGQGGSTYALTDTANVEVTSGTAFTLTLSATDKTAVKALLNKDGAASVDATTYNIAAAEDWAAGADAAVVVADLTGNGITASNASTSIVSATYNAATGVLSVTGNNMTAGDTIDVSKLTLTGEGGSTYTLTSANVTASSATAFSVTLNATDQAALGLILNKNGTSSTSGTTFNLAGAANWDSTAAAGADSTGNGVTVSNVAAPTITSATYDAATGALVVTGTGFLSKSGATNDIVANKFTFTGEGGSTYTLTDTANVEVTSGTAFTLTLSATDKAGVGLIANKNGTSSTSGTTFNLAAAEDWAAGADSAVVIADTTGNGVTVSNVAAPIITSATYNAATGALVVTGTGFLKLNGAANDIVANKFTFTGEGGSTYTLTDTVNVEVTSGTAFTLTLSATDKAGLGLIANKNGTASTSGTTYNIAAAEDWAAGADSAVVVADTTGNGVTVSNVAVPTITSATYNASAGTLVVTGTGFLSKSGAANDIDVSKLSIAGDSTAYTLTSSNVEITSATSFTVTLNGTDKTALTSRINKAGTASLGNVTYNLAGAEDWAAGADAAVVVADLTGNGITATLNAPPSITSNGGGATGLQSLEENQTTATVVTATDPDGDTVTYSLTGGADQARFTLNATTGVLNFITAPDYELPADADSNNSYIVQVTANDGHGGTTAQTLTINVINVDESGVFVPPATPQTSTQTSTQGTVDGVTVTQTSQTNSAGQTVTTLVVPVITTSRAEDTSTANASLADIPIATTTNGSPLIQVSLPVGVGLSSEAVSSSSTQTLREQLIAASSPKVSDSAVFSEIVSAGIDQYVPSVSDQQAVAVRTVTLTAAGTSLSAPVVITGAIDAGDGNSATSRQEALVIDARNLPSGSILQFNNVEFAIVIGAARIVGGNGSNFVIGDSASQFIVLGADDDILHGGGGDDTVGSRSGNDQLFGDEGNDRVVGGLGNDTLDGGTGDDILQGGQSDAGTWRFVLNADKQLLTTFTAAESALSANPTESLLGSWTGSSAALTANGAVTFANRSVESLETITLLYHAVLDRAPTVSEMNSLAAQGLSDQQLADMVYSAHVAGRSFATQEAQIQELFTWLSGSAPSDSLQQAASQYLAQGGSWGGILLYGIHQAAFRQDLLDASGNLALTQNLVSGETGWSDDTGNDTLRGGDGNDLLIGGRGSDTLDGGNGIDTAAFSRRASDYVLTRTAEGYRVSASNGDIDSLSGIERLRFADKQLALDVSASGHAGQALEFIGTLAFNLRNDTQLRGGIIALLDQGKSLLELNELALSQGVVRQLAGSDSNLDLVRLVYRNLTGQEASSAQANALVSQLQGSGGTMSQADFLTAVAQLDLNQQHVNLVGLANTGIEYL